MTPTHPPLVRTLSRLRGAFWRRRFLHGLLRAAWLALLVPTVVMAGYLVWGWQISWPTWAAISGAVALIALIWAMRPINLKKMSYRLDSLLGTRSQIVTALEVSQTGDDVPNPVADRLLHDAVALAVSLRRKIRLFNHGFWIEMNALIAVASLLGAMLILDALVTNIPNATPLALLPPGQEPGADEIAPVDAQLFPPPFQPPRPLTPEQIQAALDALADALRDQAVTRAAAEAIDQGDLSGAAEALRRLADQLEGLSEEAQQALGESLQEGAENTQEVPDLTEPLQSGSQALEQGDTAQGSQSLEELAEALETLEEMLESAEIAPQAGAEEPGQSESETGQADDAGEESAEMEEAEGGAGAGGGEEGEGDSELGQAEERLPIDGEPLELESESDLEERVLQPSKLDAQADGTTTDRPFARQPLNADAADLGADPLTYPWEKRQIVREYFTPPPER